MPTEEIGIRLALKDRLRFSSEARKAAMAVDEIGDQAKQASVAMATMGKVGRSLGRTAFTAMKYGAIGAAGGLAVLGGASIKAFMEAEKVAAQTNAVIKSTGGAAGVSANQVDMMSRRLMSLSGVSDEAIASGTNLLLTFTNIRNKVNGEFVGTLDSATSAALDMSVALGTDVKSSAQMLGKALNDPAAGLTRLTRAGVVFSAQQTKQIEKMTEAGKVAQAQQIILDEVAREFGGSAAALGKTAEGQFNIFKETIGNTLEEIGAKLLPVLTDVLPGLTDTLSATIKSLGPVVTIVAEAFGKSLAPVLKALGPVFEQLGKVFASLAKAVAPVLVMVGEMAAKIMKMLMPAIKPLVGALGKALLQIFKALKPVLPDIVKAIVQLTKAFIPLIPVITKIIVLMLRMSGPVIKKLAQIVTWISKWVIRPITRLFKGFVTDWSGTWQTVKDVLADYWRGIKNFFGGIVNWFKGIPGKIGRAVSGMWNGIKTSFRSVINWVIGAWNRLELRIPSFDPPGPGPTFPGFTLGTPDIPMLEHGGRALANRPVIVGEKRAEVFVPDRSGTVLPDASFALAGGDTFNFFGDIYTRAPDGHTLLRELKAAAKAKAARK